MNPEALSPPVHENFLGIVVNPAYVQVEGLQAVFDNLERAGAQAIAIWPYILRRTEKGQGGRMPDLHIDGTRRQLERPLWGRRELYVNAFLGYEPDYALYEADGYRPPPAAPTAEERTVPQSMIEEAQRRGIAVHLGIGPFTLPQVRDADRPQLVDGSPLPPPYIAGNACLNSPSARRYALAAIEDLLRHYPQADGLILDWVEFGAYRLEEHFTCFCAHCYRAAQIQGVNWGAMQADVSALWDALHHLDDEALARIVRAYHSPSYALELLTHYPGWLAFLQFKAQSVVGFYGEVRALLDSLGLKHIALSARGWCPPWNRSSGMDYRALAGICDAITPKLFTFDHSALPRWMGQTLKAWNPHLDEAELIVVLLTWLELPDDISPRSFDAYYIPAPDESHPVHIASYGPRLNEVADQVGHYAHFYPITHPYLPAAQWQEMVALVRDSRAGGMWVNMYGYLGDKKIEILRRTWHSTPERQRRAA